MKVGIISTGRADYSIYRPLLDRLREDPDVELIIYALGMHVSKKYGYTYKIIESDGFRVLAANDSLSPGDSPQDISMAMARTSVEMIRLIDKKLSDIYFCLGDRYEMLSAVSVLVPLNKPIIHISGGENTEGAIDNKFRNAITKISDYHFTTTEAYRRRVIQLGALPTSVYNVGSLGVEQMLKVKKMNLDEIKVRYGVDLSQLTAIVTYQPVTTQLIHSEEYIGEFCSALEELDFQIVITLGNADPAGDLFRTRLRNLAEKKPQKFYVFESLGPEGYPSFLSHCDIMLGNSSSGIVEAASMNLPVVNVGDRQKGRECSGNVVHVGSSKKDILGGVTKALKLRGKTFHNIYGSGDTSEQIYNILKSQKLEANYEFYDLPNQ